MSDPALSVRQRQFLHHIRTTTNAVLHYDHVTDDLAVWYWPTNERGERVSPSDLGQHRQSHRMRGPCCTCAAEGGNIYTESIIAMATEGRHAGEYVASCPNSRCTYLIIIEQYYNKAGLPVRYYTTRGIDDHRVPARNGRVPNEDDRVHPYRRVMRFVSMDEILERRPPTYSPATAFSQLLRLDDAINPGLTAAEFVELFAKCSSCQLVMTQRIFWGHECPATGIGAGADAEMIDLTEIDDDNLL